MPAPIKTLSFLSLLLLSQTTWALSITTWNVEHLMSEAVFKDWAQACKAADWDEAKARAQGKPRHLTYCNAGNGLSWPCPNKRQSLALQTPGHYAMKVAQLKKRAQTLNSDIYALQEVSDAAAVKRILPQGYQIFFPADHTDGVPMNVAFAVKNTLKANAATLPQLSVCEEADRKGQQAWDCKSHAYRTRPGLVLRVQTDHEKTLHLLNIHLKSGCRSDIIDDPQLDKPGTACPIKGVSQQQATANRRASKKRGCDLLREQVPVLEQWVEQQTQAGHDFMILGDFNRRLFGRGGDLSHPARLDGSDPASPIHTDTPIGSLVKEMNDDKPAGSGVWFVKTQLDKPGKYSCKDENNNTYSVRSCHQGIDHFALGYALADRLTNDRSSLRASGQDYGQSNYCAENARVSDHCPVTLVLPE